MTNAHIKTYVDFITEQSGGEVISEETVRVEYSIGRPDKSDTRAPDAKAVAQMVDKALKQAKAKNVKWKDLPNDRNYIADIVFDVEKTPANLKILSKAYIFDNAWNDDNGAFIEEL